LNMPRLGDFEAWIEVDGARLSEFRVEIDEHTQTVRCWIPSEAGKNFVLHMKDHTKLHTTAGRVYIDGSYRCGSVLQPHASYHLKEGYPLTRTTISLFQFAPILLIDDEEGEIAEDEKFIKSLGTIQVVFNDGVEGKSRPFMAPDVPAAKALHEKLKKAGGHCVQSGGEKACLNSHYVHFIEDGAAPYRIIFQYRPKDMLQALDIMPREIRPVDEEADETDAEVKPEESDTETLDGDQGHDSAEDDEATRMEMQELEKRMNELRERKKRKSDKMEPKGGRRKRAKVEPIEAGRFFTRGEIIDLT